MTKTRELLRTCEIESEKLQREKLDSNAAQQRMEVVHRGALDKVNAKCHELEIKKGSAEDAALVAKRKAEDEKRRGDGFELELNESLEREQKLRESEEKLKNENSEYVNAISALKDLV